MSGTNGQANLQTGNLTLGAGGGSCSSDDRLLPSSRSSENPHPIISVRYTLPAGQPVPGQITAQLTFGGLQGPKVFYDTAGLQPGEELRFVLQADATTLPTGRYAWEMVVTTGTGPGAQQHVFAGHREVFNRIDSEFGNRLWIDDLDRLIVYPDGVSLIRGDGTAGWFRKDSNGELVTPLGSLSSLQQNQDGSFTLLRRWGSRDEFDASGLLTTRVDRHGNETQYLYTDADDDLVNDELSEVIDPFGRSTIYSYSGGLLESVTDPAGRTTTYQYNSSRFLTIVAEEDPDGAGPLAAPVTLYGHDSEGRVTRVTDPAGRVTDYTYNFAGRLQTETIDGQTWEIAAREVQGLVDLSQTGFNASNLAASTYLVLPAVAVHSDQNAQQTTLELDRFGYTTSRTDALGNQWFYERNANGQVVKMTGPDPDGDGPLLAPVTEYEHDSAGNVTKIIHPDLTEVSFTYDATFNQITSYTDELGRVTLHEIDPTNGNLLEIRQVVGQDDRTSSENDDVVTSYTYTDGSGDLPAGLLSSETDPLGRTTSYVYYSNPSNHQFGWLQSVTLAVGTADQATIGYEYDPAGNVTAVIDPLGRRTEHEYDALSRRIQTTLPDPDGAGPLAAPVYSYEYNAIGQLTREIDPLLRVTEYDFDARGNLIQISRPDQDGDSLPTVTSLNYDSVGRLQSITDPLGNVTSYHYDVIGQLIQITAPDPDAAGPLAAPITQFSYDPLGRLQFVTDPLGNITEHRYDLRDRLIESILPDPDGAGPLLAPQLSFEFDAAGQLISETDPLGRQTSYAYDPLGRLESVLLPDPDGGGPLAAPQYSYVYNQVGSLIAQTDPLGNTTTFAHDALDRLSTITEADPDGAGPLAAPVTSYAYDTAGQLTSVTDPLGRQTTRQYDNLGRLTKLTLPDPDGAGPGISPFTLFEYDAVGNLLSQENALGHITSFGYNALDWRISTTDPNNDTTYFTYNDAGQLTSLLDPVGNETSWIYDGLGRTIQETNELADSRYFIYDAAGNLIQRTDRNGRVIEYEYDNLYRRTTETWLDGSTPLRTFSYSYDAASRLIAASDPSASYTFTFDNLGRYTSVEHVLAVLSFDVIVDHAYDPLGRRTALSVEINGTADLVNQYQYDNLNRITRITQSGQSGANAVAEKRVDFDYDLGFKNHFATITRFADLAGTETVAISSYDYDFAGRLTGIDHRDGASVLLAGYGLSYDETNRLTEFLVAGYSTEDVIYNYDDTDQLIAADRDGSGNDESYSYDANGNRTLSGYSTGSNNLLLTDGTSNYTYDNEGNRLSKTNIATSESVEYSWDQRNRLTGIITRDSLGIVAHEVQYTYDIFNRRIVKIIDADGAGSGTPTQEIYIYDGLREERGSAGDQILLRFDEAEALTTRYLHGPNVDQILASEDVASPSVVGDILWALTDHLGSVRDVVEFDSSTDTTSIVNHIVYDAYGQIISESNSAVDFLYGFTGRERDAESDLQYNRARYYDAATGRWISQDPIGFDAGDTNLYRYVANQATIKTDASGLDWGYFWQTYTNYVWPWDGSGPPPVDWIDSTLQFGTQAGQVTGAVAGTAACSIYAAGYLGATQLATITFGHGARHLTGTNLSRLAVESTIRNQVAVLGAGSGAHWGWVQVGGQWIQYRAHYLQNGIVHIGTYFPVSNPLTNR